MTNTLFSSTPTPLTPPKLEEDRLSWLRLFRSRRVGVATFYRLMDEYGSAQAALDSLPEIAASAGVKSYLPCSDEQIEAELEKAARIGAALICYGDPHYPAHLMNIPDAPPLFWAVGDLNMLSRPMIAMVGARNASSLGHRMARILAKELGEAGLTVVSGLARGIDACAHDAALETGTVAVLAGGVDIPYPSENKVLFDEIGRRGLRISEQVMGLAPQARHFPPRNRIISGLACGLVVVEAAARSGSLITANNALDQGRDVMAVPGHPFDARAAGCNMLLRDGAQLIRSAIDVLEILSVTDAQQTAPTKAEPQQSRNWRSQAISSLSKLTSPNIAAEPPQNGARMAANGVMHPAKKVARISNQTIDIHSEIINRLGPSPLSEDQLIRDLPISTGQAMAALTDLELDGQICRQSGGMIALTT
ncbi:MAG: DNA-processing protein DprA [Mangrovicoccus sp.]